MKLLSFKEFLLREEITLPVAHGTVDITDPATVLNINTLLGRALNQEFITPYIALEKVRQVLAHFSVSLEGTTKLFDGDEGSFTFAVMQFGGIVDPTKLISEAPIRFVYFTWELNEEGSFDVWAEMVTEEELAELIDDEEEEDFDDEIEAEPDYGPPVSEDANETLSPFEKKLDKEHDAGKKLSIVKETGNVAKIQAIRAMKKWKAPAKKLDERTLTPAEKKKREEVAKAIERENPGIDMSKKMAIATATAKKSA